MKQSISIVQHFTGDLASLGSHLPELTRELQARGAGDEVVLVDDTGEELLTAWARENFPAVRVVTKNRREGRSKALLVGAQAAVCEYLFLLGPEIRVQRGCLGPLLAAMQGPGVFAVAPRVVHWQTGEPELSGPLEVEQGRPVVMPSELGPDEVHMRPVPFAPGASTFMRREAFLARAGFDDLFPSPYWEDVDFGLTAWRQGLRILEVPQAVVERHPVPNPEILTPQALDQAATERGRLLLHWKHLDNRQNAADHVQGLWRDASDAAMGDRREELVWLALALDDMDTVAESRPKLNPAQISYPDARRISDPSRL